MKHIYFCMSIWIKSLVFFLIKKQLFYLMHKTMHFILHAILFLNTKHKKKTMFYFLSPFLYFISYFKTIKGYKKINISYIKEAQYMNKNWGIMLLFSYRVLMILLV